MYLAATVAHIVYTVVLLYRLIPVVRLHVRFVSSNMLAEEWKHDLYYRDPVTGTPVLDLSEEEFDLRYDDFVYDPLLNPYDHGCFRNWQVFWCAPRRSRTQRGDF